MACMLKAFSRISRIDARLVPAAQEESTPGEAVAGMILHGVGFAHRPLSLTPQFFPNPPLALLWRPGGRAEMGHRFQLGRTLDAVQASGGERLWSAWALAGCAQERLAPRCQPLDTTRWSLRGHSVSASATPALAITHGDAKAHRPDVQQGV